MSGAAEAAEAAGTPAEVLAVVKDLEFLRKCLLKAKFNADLLQDTLDACEINDLDALMLGSSLLSVAEASEKLFLMQDEASRVVKVCRQECLRAGVNFGDGATLDDAQLDAEEEPETEPAAAATSPPLAAAPATEQRPELSASAAVAMSSSAAVAEPAPAATPGPAPSTAQAPPPSVTTPAPSSSKPAPTPAAETSSKYAQPSHIPRPAIPSATRKLANGTGASHPDPNFLIKPPMNAESNAGPTPPSKHSNIPRGPIGTPPAPSAREKSATKPSHKPATTPGGASASATPASQMKHSASSKAPASAPAANGTAGSAKTTPASHAKTPRPTSAPLRSSMPAMPTNSANRPQSAVATPPNAPTPSYAKPTAAHKARVSKDDEEVPSTSAAVNFASTNKPMKRFLFIQPRAPSSEEKKEVKKPVFDNIRSSLLRPTAAFLAWTQGKGKKDKQETDLKGSQGLKTSQSLKINTGSQKLKPEDVAVAPAAKPKSQSHKPPTPDKKAAAPAAADTSSPGGSTATPPGGKGTTPEPFRLAGLERHQKAQEELQRKIEEKAKAESAACKQFKASPVPSSGRKVSKWGSGGGSAAPPAEAATQTGAAEASI